MKKAYALTICVLLLLESICIATPDSLKIATNAYFQAEFDHPMDNFSLPYSKVGIKGVLNVRWSGYMELRPTNGNPLIKAYIDCQFRPYFITRVGQFTNPFKWVELPPDQRHIPFFAVCEQYVANGDDIGVAVLGTVSRWSYYLCVINGSGKNIPDNNRAKDVTGYATYKLPLTSLVELCWQVGRQPDGLRQGGFARLTSDPFSLLHWEAAYTARCDLHRRGWYTLVVVGPQKIQLTTRLHQTIQNESITFTFGLQGHPARNIKWQSAMAVTQDYRPRVATVIQFNL